MNPSPREAWSDAKPVPFWLDDPARPAARPAVQAEVNADLAIVGGGFSGLWTALLAKERMPGRDVVLLEGQRIGWAASGRNGGFCSASLTHGRQNGLRHFPHEYEQLHRLGQANLDEIEATIARYGIDCGFQRTGTLSVATEPWQAAEFDGAVLDQDAVRAEVNSPRYLAGVWDEDGSALINPARLAWGLAAACEAAGVRVFEHSAVENIARDGTALALQCPAGIVRARHVALGTNAFPSLLARLRLFTVPVYDYVLMTEPLSAAQLESIGWANRQGVSEESNQFHYSRMTSDNRILWGGYDAIYHYGRGLRAGYDQRPATFDRLSSQFFDTFPQLAGVRFSHRWGGAIDTCTRFCAFYGTAYRGQLSYALGFTGLGVGASRFGANVMLDLLDGEQNERTRLSMVRRRPIPFPPEPLTYLGIEVTKRSLARADLYGGRRNTWLRTLDRIGLGFDS